MSEEIEVKVRQIENESASPEGENTAMFELIRRLMLAGIGAVALTYDEAERLVNRLVERGELAHKDGEKILNELMGSFRQGSQQVSNISGQIETGLEQLLSNLNIPTKRDMDELSSKVAKLSENIEELQRSGNPQS